MKKIVPPVLLLAAALVAAMMTGRAPAQNIFQYGFETRDPIWVKGGSDAPFREIAHRLTDETARTGTRSELISLEVQQGTFIHYTYDVGRGPIAEELTIGVWVKSNRPGTRILARAVLPRERDPNNLDQPLTVLLPGDVYTSTSRWQQVRVRQPTRRLREQQQLLRAQLKRDIVIEDAYVDRIVLNVYSGPGATQVWTDDLEVGPVDENVPRQTIAAPVSNPDPRGGAPTGAGGGTQPLVTQRALGVSLRDKQLVIGFAPPGPGQEGNPGQPLFMRGIRHTGTPLKTLHQAGFNTLFLDETTPPGLVEDAVNLGFWIVPMLRPPDNRPDDTTPAQLASRDAFGRKVAFFLGQEAVLCWDLGTNLPMEQFDVVSRTAEAIRKSDPMRPVSADVSDGFQRYSRHIEELMIGIHRFPLMTSMSMVNYRDWLTQHRLLAVPGSYCWTWIQTHLPDWYTALAYDRPVPDSPGGGPSSAAQEPIGPQPEQIRLLSYIAIGAGYRGLGFWSDRYLADTHTGRDRLLELALINQELQMLEPLLCSTEIDPSWIDTSSPNVKAAVLRCKKGILVLPMWIGTGAQFVPGQSSAISLDVTVPHVPTGCQCWEVCPGNLHSMRWERVVGGVKVTLHEFSMTSALVFTSDLGTNGLVVRLQDHQRRIAKTAAQWSYDLAEEELKKIQQVQAELQREGKALPDEAQLLDKTRSYLETSLAHRKNGDWDEAYADAQRAMRPLRIFMRAHWEKATKELTTPLASPYDLSFYTLPRHWRFWEEVKRTKPGANLLTDGNFEMPPTQVQQGWQRQESPSLDEVTAVARRVSEQPYCEGKQCLMLKVSARDPLHVPSTLERTYIAVHTPAVPVKPGTLVQITFSVRIPSAIAGSADGALFYDSVCGEQMAMRLTDGLPKWKKYVLYRRIPASGTISLTMALTGLGTAYFDDVRIEPLSPDPNQPAIQPVSYVPR